MLELSACLHLIPCNRLHEAHSLDPRPSKQHDEMITDFLYPWIILPRNVKGYCQVGRVEFPKARSHLFHRLHSGPARSRYGSFHHLNPMSPCFETKRVGIEEASLRRRLPSSVDEGPQDAREAAWKKVIRRRTSNAGSALRFDKSLQRHTLSAKLNKRIPSNDGKEEVSLTHAFIHRRGAHIHHRWIPIVRALAFMLLNPVRSLYIR